MYEFISEMKKFSRRDRGRTSRKDFWMFYLVYCIACLLLAAIGHYVDSYIFTGKAHFWSLYKVFIVFMLLPLLSIMGRRLHDINKSGWYIFLFLIPFAGLYVIYLFCKKGDEGENMYGPSPYASYQTSINQGPIYTNGTQQSK